MTCPYIWWKIKAQLCVTTSFLTTQTSVSKLILVIIRVKGTRDLCTLKGMFFHFFVYFYVLKLDRIARMMTRMLISDACTCTLTPPAPPTHTHIISQLYRADVFIYSLVISISSWNGTNDRISWHIFTFSSYHFFILLRPSIRFL